MYDLIGDIHGHADELEHLLQELGYQKTQGVYSHPEHKVVFLGDFIDRGPKIRQVLEIVRPMIEEEKALGVMGNHEFNALAYHTEDPEAEGEYLRPHSVKNTKQHSETLHQLTPQLLGQYMKRFRKLPLWLDLEGLRVVHACWDEQKMLEIQRGITEFKGISDKFLAAACKKHGKLFHPVEVILKGKEVTLPPGICFNDKDGNERTEIRTRWYLSPQGHTYGTYALQSDEIACDQELDPGVISNAIPYPVNAKPVFVGHYWLAATQPEVLAENVACLDYSVAKDGFLCAYRWQGEVKLSNKNFVWGKAKFQK